jgi:TolB-like protein
VIVSDDALAQCVSDLRRALNDTDRKIIKTVPRRGYLFGASVAISIADTVTPLPAVAPSKLSLMVLPFVGLSKDSEEERVAQIITEDLTTDLSHLLYSFVISRTTALRYQENAVGIRQIGRELGFRYVLEGSVQWRGDQFQINVQLTDAETSGLVWADRFETRLILPEEQSEICIRLVRAVQFELVKDVNRRIELERSPDADVRDLIIRGRALRYTLPAQRTQTLL